jgi:hypothetical protein
VGLQGDGKLIFRSGCLVDYLGTCLSEFRPTSLATLMIAGSSGASIVRGSHPLTCPCVGQEVETSSHTQLCSLQAELSAHSLLDGVDTEVQ